MRMLYKGLNAWGCPSGIETIEKDAIAAKADEAKCLGLSVWN